MTFAKTVQTSFKRKVIKLRQPKRLTTPTLRFFGYVGGYGWGPRDCWTGRYPTRIIKGCYIGSENVIEWGLDAQDDEPCEEDFNVLNHEYLHWVLHKRIGRYACDALDRIRFALNFMMKANGNDKLITTYLRQRRKPFTLQRKLTEYLNEFGDIHRCSGFMVGNYEET